MIVYIVGGGPPEFIPDLKTDKANPDIFWIGVDRGNRYLLDKGITPAVAIGDFDSVTKEELEVYQSSLPNVLKYQTEKDETDMELALQVASQQNPSLIRIFGATGGRLDHMLANLFLLMKPIAAIKNASIEIIDRQNILEVKRPGQYLLEQLPDKQYISFIPFTQTVENLSLVGFKYPLKDRNIFIGSTLCISNELIQRHGTYSFSKGILLVVRSND
ncbi:thiamine diphosphokinase [Caldibacillus lycopersici]|uniref:Thiamine diphosphokinase n=1 Tax=Perspicuibacillus lycopersici TaxID=1325689 RepID=A0AAE3IQ50_9BACI|nr:thiamine diphosphokinase [Perspicuibacillus lycopersici]MCU9612152.1 thiamine diphosphokinase [Perspicuibacillus lycopersici]